jgi:hypothetical protein
MFARHITTRRFLILLLSTLLFAPITLAADSNDLYKLLGVDRKATVQEIKSAYRRKARDTHPDKNQNVPAQQAAEEFHKVVQAFEVLSDVSSRRRYDQTGRQDSGNSAGGGNWNNWQWSSGQQNNKRGSNNNNNQYFYWNFRPPVALKDRFDVQEAMSRVLHVVSLEQLKLIMLDENDLLERNILICAYTPPLEKNVDEEMVRQGERCIVSCYCYSCKYDFFATNSITHFFVGLSISIRRHVISRHLVGGLASDRQNTVPQVQRTIQIIWAAHWRRSYQERRSHLLVW